MSSRSGHRRRASDAVSWIRSYLQLLLLLPGHRRHNSSNRYLGTTPTAFSYENVVGVYYVQRTTVKNPTYSVVRSINQHYLHLDSIRSR